MRAQLAGSLLALGLLSTACDATPPSRPPAIEVSDDFNERCDGLSDDYAARLDAFPGEEMRQDRNEDPIFRAASVNIATHIGYGSGGLYERADKSLTIRTIEHVSDMAHEIDDNEEIGVFIPGYGWFSTKACDINVRNVEQVLDGEVDIRDPLTGRVYDTDVITEFDVPDEVADRLRPLIEAGEITPLGAFVSSNVQQTIGRVATSGGFIMMARPDTGEYFGMDISDFDTAIDGSQIRGLPLEIPGLLGNACQGNSGQPMLWGELVGNGDGILDENDAEVNIRVLGVISFGDYLHRDIEGERDNSVACSIEPVGVTFIRAA